MNTSDDIKQMLTQDGYPISVDEVNESLNDKIHQELFNDSLEKYSKENGIVLENYKIIEVRDYGKSFLSPSKVILFDKRSFTCIKVDLAEWWNENYKYDKPTDEASKSMISSSMRKNNKVEYINYVNGDVIISDKLTGKKSYVPFNQISTKNITSKNISNTFIENSL